MKNPQIEPPGRYNTKKSKLFTGKKLYITLFFLLLSKSDIPKHIVMIVQEHKGNIKGLGVVAGDIIDSFGSRKILEAHDAIANLAPTYKTI